MEKIKINMLSKADSVDGQGVGSAYQEQLKLVKEGADDIFDISVNKRGKYDIYHIHTVNFGFYLKMLFHRKSEFITYVHFLPETLDGSIKLPKFAFKIFKSYVKSFYRKANHIVVVNPIFIEPLEKLGIKKENIEYIPNFVDHETFKVLDHEKVSEVRKKYQINPNSFVVLGVGQVQHRKGVLDFIDVANKNPDITFVWAGGFSFGFITDGYNELKKIYENPPENVKFLGIVKRDEMNEVYNMADCLFMPSYNELFPMSILEAVNVKKPIVLRNLDLYEKILFDKYSAAEDNEGFSSLIRKLQQDKNYYEKEVEKSNYIAQYYSKDNVLNIWREYYTRIYNEHMQKRK